MSDAIEGTDTDTSGYERRKQRKRGQIISAAAAMFRERGFSRVSVNQIAERANVSPVTIYNHYRDKHGLVAAVLEHITDEKIEEYRKVLTSPAPWTERLRIVVTDKRQLLWEYGREFLETLYGEYGDLVEGLVGKKARARQKVTHPFLDEGRALGYVPDDISNEAVETWLEVISRGFQESGDVLTRAADRPELMADIFELILYGLVRPEGKA